MARTIEFADDALRIHYSGWIRLFLGREAVAPYAQIQWAEVGLHELPSMTRQTRRRVTKGKIVRGRFKDSRGNWYFFDFRHRDRAVTIVLLPGSRYTMLGIEADGNPETFVAELRSRL